MIKKLIHNFLKDESGILPVLIGGALASGAIGSGTGALIAQGVGSAILANEAKPGVQTTPGMSPEMSTLLTARGAMKAQKRHGINALELIRGGAGANGHAPTSFSVGSQAVMNGHLDQMQQVLSGRQALEENRQEVEDDIRRIERDILAARADSIGRGPQYSIEGIGGMTSSALQSQLVNADNPRARLAYGDSLTLDGKDGKLEEPTAAVEEMVGYGRAPNGDVYPVIQDPEVGIQIAGQMAAKEAKEVFTEDIPSAVGPMASASVRKAQEKVLEGDISRRTDEEILRDNIKKNNPGISEAQILQMMFQITGGQYGQQ
jgi:hypothetical protein